MPRNQAHHQRPQLVFARVFSTRTDGPGDDPRDTSHKPPVEEHAGEASSREFEALTLGTRSPPTLDSAHRSKQSAYDTASSKIGSEVVEEEKPKDESDSDWEEVRRMAKEHRAQYESLSSKEWSDKLKAIEAAELAAIWERNAPRQCLPDVLDCARWESTPIPQQKSWVTPGSKLLHMLGWSSSDDDEHLSRQRRQRPPGSQSRSEELSDEQIIENGRKWMSEEVMVAFKKYTEKCADQTGLDYQFGELLHQCLNVEDYYKTFHHFNFTMKLKDPTSCGWRVELYFAEMMQIFRRKYYFCCPLESLADGHCYGCKNQGVNDLKHPATGGFEQGCPASTFPYM